MYVGSKDVLAALQAVPLAKKLLVPVQPGMSNYLTGIDWQYLLSVNLAADSLWAAFHSVLLEAIKLHVPSIMVVGYIRSRDYLKFWANKC